MANSNSYDEPQILQQSHADSPPLPPPKYDEPSGSATAAGYPLPPPAYPSQTVSMGPGQGYENATYFLPGGFGQPGQAPPPVAPPGYTYGAAVAGVGAGQQMPGAPYIATQQPMPTDPVMFRPMGRYGAVIMIGAGQAPSMVIPSPTAVIVIGIIASICCFWLCGIPAIILGYYAMKTQRTINGDWSTWLRARQLSRSGLSLGIIGISLAFSTIIFLVVYLPITLSTPPRRG